MYSKDQQTLAILGQAFKKLASVIV